MTCGGEEKVVATTALASTRANVGQRDKSGGGNVIPRAVDSVRGGGGKCLMPILKIG